MIPAVRSVDGTCIEEDNCDWEKVTLCAFNLTDTAGEVSFLACMDEQDGEASSAAKSCASTQNLDYNTINGCFTGAQGQELLAVASKAYNDQFPSSTYVPHVFVDDKEFSGDTTSPSYSVIKQALCDGGSNATVCKGMTACLA